MAMARILIIDDDELVCYALRLVLVREGHDIIDATNGRNAIDLLRERHRCDLVITDLIMPDMGGTETISTMRKMLPDVAIIALTRGGRLDPRPLLQLARNSGADAAIAKPVNRKDLIDLVSRLVA